MNKLQLEENYLQLINDYSEEKFILQYVCRSFADYLNFSHTLAINSLKEAILSLEYINGNKKDADINVILSTLKSINQNNASDFFM